MVVDLECYTCVYAEHTCVSSEMYEKVSCELKQTRANAAKEENGDSVLAEELRSKEIHSEELVVAEQL